MGIAGTLTFDADGVSTTAAYAATDSLEDIAATINGNATLTGANISASVVDDGAGRRLVVTDADQDNFVMTDSGTFLSTTGMASNATSASTVFAVRSDIIADPARVSRAELNSAAGLAAGDIGVTTGDSAIASDLAGVLSSDVTFPAAGSLSATTATFASYASSILSLQSTNAAEAESKLDFNNSYLTTLEARNSATSGVNVDEELANLIILQQSFNASARVLTTASDMLEELLNIAR
jgi:flagellar hook-associated protein 1 FlgK